MERRTVLKALAGLPLFSWFAVSGCTASGVQPAAVVLPTRWVRPGKPGWPSPAQWAALGQSVGGRLVRVQSAFTVCEPDASSAACTDLFQNLLDPFYIDRSVNLTQTLGWTGAFTSEPSAYAVLAASSADVAAAVNFAHEHNVRLVVKGGGHSYLGTSNAPDSLLIWTRPNMAAVEVLDSFVPQGAARLVKPEPAVSVGAGAIWMDAYNAVTTVAGRYVQGGGCTTVGVGGLTQGGGFGSFSKGFGTAAANLLEAEVVTADGAVRIVNAFQDADLFWALKGGGGGTFGVVTRFTLRTHELPEYFGAAGATISASSDTAYQALVEQMISFYQQSLFNPHWGEQITFGPGSQISVAMAFQGLTRPRQSRPGHRSSTGSRPARPTTRSPARKWQRSRHRTTGMRLSSSCTPPKTSCPMTCRVRRKTITTGRATPARLPRSGPPTSQPGCRSSFSTRNTSLPWSMRSCMPASTGR